MIKQREIDEPKTHFVPVHSTGSRECQRKDWPSHRKECSDLARKEKRMRKIRKRRRNARARLSARAWWSHQEAEDAKKAAKQEKEEDAEDEAEEAEEEEEIWEKVYDCVHDCGLEFNTYNECLRHEEECELNPNKKALNKTEDGATLDYAEMGSPLRALYFAIMMGDLLEIKKLLASSPGLDYETFAEQAQGTSFTSTPLIYAVEQPYLSIEVVELLISRLGMVEMPRAGDGVTALMLAIKGEWEEGVRALLGDDATSAARKRYNGDEEAFRTRCLSLKDTNGRSAVHYACDGGTIEIASYLRRYALNPRDALSLAIRECNVKAVANILNNHSHCLEERSSAFLSCSDAESNTSEAEGYERFFRKEGYTAL